MCGMLFFVFFWCCFWFAVLFPNQICYIFPCQCVSNVIFPFDCSNDIKCVYDWILFFSAVNSAFSSFLSIHSMYLSLFTLIYLPHLTHTHSHPHSSLSLPFNQKFQSVHEMAMFIWNYCVVLVVISLSAVIVIIRSLLLLMLLLMLFLLLLSIFIQKDNAIAFQSLTFFCHYVFSFIFPIHLLENGCVMPWLWLGDYEIIKQIQNDWHLCLISSFVSLLIMWWCVWVCFSKVQCAQSTFPSLDKQ